MHRPGGVAADTAHPAVPVADADQVPTAGLGHVPSRWIAGGVSRTAAPARRLPHASSAHPMIPGNHHPVTAADGAIAREPPFGVAEQVFQQTSQQCPYEVICAASRTGSGVWMMAGRILGCADRVALTESWSSHRTACPPMASARLISWVAPRVRRAVISSTSYGFCLQDPGRHVFHVVVDDGGPVRAGPASPAASQPTLRTAASTGWTRRPNRSRVSAVQHFRVRGQLQLASRWRRRAHDLRRRLPP